jgi:hypothetical protein
MAKVIKARSELQDGFSVFLAGSVAGNDWRSDLVKRLDDTDIIFLDPRSDDYSSMEHIANDPLFRAQVEWETGGLEKANAIVLYFNPDSEAPISLLEFGLFARSGRMIVRCPEGYPHKGYVDILCGRYNVGQVETLDEITNAILSRYKKHSEEAG